MRSDPGFDKDLNAQSPNAFACIGVVRSFLNSTATARHVLSPSSETTVVIRSARHFVDIATPIVTRVDRGVLKAKVVRTNSVYLKAKHR